MDNNIYNQSHRWLLSNQKEPKELINIAFEVPLKAFLFHTVSVNNLVYFNEESWESNCKVAIITLRNWSYNHLKLPPKLEMNTTIHVYKKKFLN